MPKLLVTGGSGMLGSYVASQAAQSGWETWATYSAHPVDLPGCRTVKADIRRAEEIDAIVADLKPDVVIHTAAIVKPDVCEEYPRGAFETNILGAFNTIQAAERVEAHFIHVSTDLVFEGERGPIKEDDILCPPNYYGLTKTAADVILCVQALGTTAVSYAPAGGAWVAWGRCGTTEASVRLLHPQSTDQPHAPPREDRLRILDPRSS